MGKNSQYGVIFDAGSSGTRLYVYKWKNPITASRNASPTELRSLPKLKLKETKKIHPGIATFAQDVTSVGRDHLQSLVNIALDEVPSDKIKETPIFLLATAGMRLLPKQQQLSLLHSICSYLQMNTHFHLPDCGSHVQVIAGETEGLYGWIATNYLIGGFDQPDEHAHGEGHHTYGFLDMGGASAQIAFAPNAREAERHANDLKLVRMRRLDGSSSEYKVFTATWLGFGANSARSRHIQNLVAGYGEFTKEIPDPCMPKGLHKSVETSSDASEQTEPGSVQVLIGTGAFDECLKATYPLLRKDAPCEDHPCLLNGQHVPAIDFDINHFIGVSEYWHATHGVFGKEKKTYDFVSYQRQVREFCSRDWAAIQDDIIQREKTTEKKLRDAQEACFKASWLINVLYEGIGIPRLGIEKSFRPGPNTTDSGVEKGKEDFLNPFQPIDKVHGVEVSWTLGRMLLYAAGQIPPDDSSLPVGFGSNVASKMPPDFEHAGSIPLSQSSYSDTDGNEINDSKPILSGRTYSILGLVLVLILVTCLLRRPDRRHRILSMVPWRRRHSGSRKPRRGLTSTWKLFGRSSTNYERVLEEGENAEYELDITSDDLDSSDSSEGSRANRYISVGTTKIDTGRLDGSQPALIMDRTGMVLRTESRERLSPNLQMLNAGRRSRAPSPTRLKSPRMTPLQDG